MVIIRPYRESDVRQVGVLIADTYSEFYLSGFSKEQRDTMLDSFWYARSVEPSHQKNIAEVIRASSVLVAGILCGHAAHVRSRQHCHLQSVE